MKTALYWSGGGARSIFGVGYAKALEEIGVQWDMGFGVSAGGLLASLFHVYGSELMIEIWKNLRTKDVCNLAPWRIFSNSPSFYDTSPLRRLIESHMDLDHIKLNPKPLYINSTDIGTWTTRSQEIHDFTTEKDLIDALMSSAGAPIAFPATNNAYDGGLTSNYSISQAVKLGCDRIIILGLSVPEFSQVKSIVDAFEAVASIPEYAQLNASIAETNRLNDMPGKRKIEIIVIKPEKPTGINLLDFDLKGFNRDDLIKYGYDLAMAALNKI